MRTIKKAFLALTLTTISASAIDYFPLAAGHTWTYRDAKSGHEFTVRVDTPVMRNDKVYYPLTGYADEQVLVRRGETTDLVYLNDALGREEVLTQFNLSGAAWPAPKRGCYHEGMLGGYASDHDGPVGPFRDVFPITYRAFGCADTGVQAEQFAPSIGMVRRVVGSIAGPRTYDLVYARVGGIAIEMPVHGRFTTAVSSATEAEELEVTLRLQTGPGPAIRLQFPSTQEYDIAVRDENGRRVWVWSADKLFAQGARERVVAGEWTAKVQIPRPALRGGYVVEAWLTTDETSTRWAAAVSVPPAR